MEDHVELASKPSSTSDRGDDVIAFRVALTWNWIIQNCSGLRGRGKRGRYPCGPERRRRSGAIARRTGQPETPYGSDRFVFIGHSDPHSHYGRTQNQSFDRHHGLWCRG